MASMKDIAEVVGVSITTVSRILNDTPGFSYNEDTRDRVLNVAQRLNWTPSAVGRALVSGRTRIVAVGSQVPDDPHPSRTLATVTRIARTRGYELMLHPAAWRDEFREAQRLLESGMLDVYLAIHGNWESIDLLTSSAKKPHQIVVFAGPLGEQLPRRVLASGWSESAALRIGLEHLAQLGHRHVAFLVGGSHTKWHSVERVLNGFDLDLTPIVLEEEDDRLSLGAKLTCRALELPRPPTAIFSRSDEVAMAALSVLHERGIRVPEDVSVIGYGDIPTSMYTVPRLTTIASPYVEAAECALQRALDCSEENRKPSVPQHITFQARLVERNSTGPANPARKRFF